MKACSKRNCRRPYSNHEPGRELAVALNLVTSVELEPLRIKRRVQGLAGAQRGSFLSELGSPLCWKLEEKEFWMTAVLKFVFVSSGDSSKGVRERGYPKLLRISQNLAKTLCLERALLFMASYYVRSA